MRIVVVDPYGNPQTYLPPPGAAADLLEPPYVARTYAGELVLVCRIDPGAFRPADVAVLSLPPEVAP